MRIYEFNGQERNGAAPSNDQYETVGLMFGRFNPPHKGHKAAWEMAAQNDHWYIGTNQSTQGKKDPLPYDVKIKAMEALWPEVSSHIVPETNLFTLAARVYAEHGEVPVVVYTDEAWLITALEKYNGEQAKHGYYKFSSITNQETPRLSSATDVRNAVQAGDRAAFERAAGVSADTVVDGKPYFDLVAEYLNPYFAETAKSDKYTKTGITEEFTMDIKQLNEMRKLAGLPLMEAAPVDYYGMKGNEGPLADIGRLLMQAAETESDDQLSGAMAALGGALAEGKITDQEGLVNFIKTYKVPALRGKGDNPNDVSKLPGLSREQMAALSDRTTKAIKAYNAGERADIDYEVGQGRSRGGDELDEPEDDFGDDTYASDVGDDEEVPELESDGNEEFVDDPEGYSYSVSVRGNKLMISQLDNYLEPVKSEVADMNPESISMAAKKIGINPEDHVRVLDGDENVLSMLQQAGLKNAMLDENFYEVDLSAMYESELEEEDEPVEEAEEADEEAVEEAEEVEEADEELEEELAAMRRIAGLEEAEEVDEEEEVEEGSKPDFLDKDGDGDKEEPMKKAIKDKKKAEESVEEAVEETSESAYQAALAELRSLAGLA